MTEAAAKRMNAGEFLDWVQAQPKGRYELLRGEIFAMAPQRAEHARTKLKVARSLTDAIERAGVRCEAFVDSLGVMTDEHTVYEPDALVNCGDPIAPDTLLAPSPAIIVEVISPSSRSIDKNSKLSDYFRLESLRHYLVVDLSRRLVLHYRRQGGEIVVAFVKEGAIALDPPGLSVDIADIFP
ncbi:MAG TPA: Uma2 family endonuclease [Methylocystis sp.]|jgi:Uma2 family endonuclease